MKKLSILTLAAMLFVACAADQTEDMKLTDTPKTLTVSFEEGTRIQLQEGKTIWTEGDLVSVFYRSNANQKWLFQGKTGDRVGNLKRVSLGNATETIPRVIVVYPYNENYYINPETYNVEAFLPFEQHYVKDSYGLDGNILISSSEYNQFSLKNVCGWMKLQFTGSETIKSIELKGNNGEQVAGQLYINSSDATATLASSMGNVDGNENGVGGNLIFDDAILTSVKLDCGEGVKLSDTPTSFFIALPPQVFEKGLTITVTDIKGGIFEKTTSRTISIERNTIQPMATIEVLTMVDNTIAFLKKNNPNSVIADVFVDMNTENVNVQTPYIIDFSNLIATFRFDNKVVKINDIDQISGVTTNNYASPITYTIQNQDNVRNITLSLSNTGIPTVVINTPNKATIPPKTADWLPDTEMIIYNTDGSIDFEGVTNIKGRGNSTWNYPKKPYAIKLNSKSEILGMPKHKRWVLLANWMDRTMMRNHIAFKTSMMTGLDWTPRGEFVEVILNGKHIGNYYLCEQIKIDSNRVNINEMEETDIEGDAITGGFLMELDTYFDEVNKFKSSIKELPYMFKEPDEDALNVPQMTYMTSYINNMEASLYNDDEFTSRKYAEYLDVDSFIDWWFVHELTGNWEPNHPKSSYMHKDKLGKLTAGPVWDFDYATYISSNAFAVKSALYYDRLFQDPEFKARAKERWNLLKDGFQSIPAFILTEADRLSSSAELNITLWPLDGQTINKDENLSFEEATNRMKEWYQNRISWLDSQITSW